MARLSREELTMDMTPMIDMVFQLMIFFLVTIKMDQDLIDETIKLAKAPHGPAIEERDLRTIVIEVNEKGDTRVGGTPIRDMRLLRGIVRGIAARTRGQNPILIRGHITTPHAYIRRVMDTCAEEGLWRIQFAAIQQEAKGKKP